MVTADQEQLRGAERLVLPGVGAFAACMQALKEGGFDEIVRERATRGTPLLGVCVGMQMLFGESEEFGRTAGLGLLPGRVRRFAGDLVVPQVGCRPPAYGATTVFRHCGPDVLLLCPLVLLRICDPEVVVGETEYGGPYASVVARGECVRVQFHPEKSQTAGLRLSNFAQQ